MEDYKSRRDTYFKVRTPEGNGILVAFMKPIIPPEAQENPIIVNHNNYLQVCHAAQVNVSLSQKNSTSEAKVMAMSGIFAEYDSSFEVPNLVKHEMANFVHMEAAYIAQSGYAANVCILQSVATKDTPVYIDEKAHASFWDGIKTSGAKGIRFRHNDVNHLKKLTESFGPGVIVVDSLYSAYGSFAPLKEIDAIRKEKCHILIVDESHTLGLYGKNGSGYCDMMSVVPDFITASLSKAFSIRAGLIAAGAKDILYIQETTVPAIFSSVVELPDFVKLKNTLDFMKNADKARRYLGEISSFVRSSLVNEDFGVVETQYPSPIICLISETEEMSCKLHQYLQKHKIHGAFFCAPATPKNGTMVRVTLNTSISMTQATYMVQTIKNYRHFSLNENTLHTQAKL